MSKKFFIESASDWGRIFEYDTQDMTPPKRPKKPRKKKYDRDVDNLLKDREREKELTVDKDPDLDKRKINLNSLIPEKDFKKAGFSVYKKGKDYISYTKNNYTYLSLGYDRNDGEIWVSGSYPKEAGKPQDKYDVMGSLIDLKKIGNKSVYEFSFLWNIGKFIKNIDIILNIKKKLLKSAKIDIKEMHKKLISDLESINEMTTTANIPNIMNNTMSIRRQPILEPLEITREKLDKASKKKKKYSALFIDILDTVDEEND